MNPINARWSSSLFLVLVAAGVALRADAGTAPGRLGLAIFDWEKLAVQPTASGERRAVVDQPTASLEAFECHATTLNPGLVSHPPHRHAQEEFIILKEGTLDIFLNGVTRRAGPGSVLFFASNDLHNVRNIGAQPATYLVFNLRTAATGSVPATPAADSAATGTLPSGVFDWEQLPAKPTPIGLHRALFNAPTATCAVLEGHVTTLNPGVTSHPPHRHPDEEVLVMKDGLLDVTINGTTQRIGPSSICFFASNDAHGVRTVGTGPATYYAIRFATAATPQTPAP